MTGQCSTYRSRDRPRRGVVRRPVHPPAPAPIDSPAESREVRVGRSDRDLCRSRSTCSGPSWRRFPRLDEIARDRRDASRSAGRASRAHMPSRHPAGIAARASISATPRTASSTIRTRLQVVAIRRRGARARSPDPRTDPRLSGAGPLKRCITPIAAATRHRPMRSGAARRRRTSSPRPTTCRRSAPAVAASRCRCEQLRASAQRRARAPGRQDARSHRRDRARCERTRRAIGVTRRAHPRARGEEFRDDPQSHARPARHAKHALHRHANGTEFVVHRHRIRPRRRALPGRGANAPGAANRSRRSSATTSRATSFRRE